LTSLESRNHDFVKETEALRNRLSQESSTVSKLTLEIGSLRNDMGLYQSDICHYKDSLDHQSKKNHTLMANLDSSQNQIGMLDHQISCYRSDIDSLTKSIKLESDKTDHLWKDQYLSMKLKYEIS
jgi:chromosome segregation ATPase